MNLFIWYTGIYGMAWSIVYAKPVQYIIEPLRKSHILNELLSCIVCTSFWCALAFVDLYFQQNNFVEKLLIVFSTVTFTWISALALGDAK